MARIKAKVFRIVKHKYYKMANLDTADLVKAQPIMTELFASGEQRFREPVTFKEFQKNTEIMIPSHNVLRMSDIKPDSEVNFFARTSRALGTGGRIHNHSGSRADSTTLTPTFTTYDDKFVWFLKQADHSVFQPLAVQLANEQAQVVKNFAEGLETIAGNYIFNNRSGVNAAGAIGNKGSFNETNDVYEITLDSEKTSMQTSKTVMDKINWRLAKTYFCDSIAFDKFEFWANQGGANSENLTFQFSNITFVKSFGLDALFAALSYDEGGWIAVQNGLIAVLDWIPKKNREGVDTKVNRYSTLIDPITGLLYGGHDFPARVDGTGSNSTTQDVQFEIDYAVDLSFNKAPLTTSNEEVLQAFALIETLSA